MKNIISAFLISIMVLFTTVSYSSEPFDSYPFSVSYDKNINAIDVSGYFSRNMFISIMILIKAHPEVKYIRIESFGGEFAAALHLSMLIKENDLSTIAVNNCHSACAYAWLVGKERIIEDFENTKISIHMPYSIEDECTNPSSESIKYFCENPDKLDMLNSSNVGYIIGLAQITPFFSHEIRSHPGSEDGTDDLVLDEDTLNTWDIKFTKWN
jgi:hypothetical protein